MSRSGSFRCAPAFSFLRGFSLLCCGAPIFCGALSGHLPAYEGASPLPPELDPADVVFFEDFESPTTLLDPVFEDGTASAVTSSVSYGGQRCLEMHNSDAGKFSYRFSLGGEYDALYARYMFRVGEAESSCWNSGQHYKLMGFEGGSQECKGGEYDSDGTDCFTVRTRFNWPGMGFWAEGYTGNLENVAKNEPVSDGRWYCFEMLVRLNDPGQPNGEVRYWIDGVERVQADLEFRIVDTLKIDKWWFTHWANDEWCGPLYLDDLVVSRARIGCPGSRPPPAVPERIFPTGQDGERVARDAVLRWRAPNADASDVFLWKSGEAKPAEPAAAGRLEGSFRPVESLLPAADYLWQVVARNEQGAAEGPVWSFRTVDDARGEIFVRGDANASGKVPDLGDAIFILNYLFQGGPVPPCAKGADANDSGEVDVSDAVTVLLYLFQGGRPIPEPAKACGIDPTPDALGCAGDSGCP